MSLHNQGVITYEEANKQWIYAFVRGTNDHLRVNYWNGSTWQWADQGTPPGTTVSDAPGVITYREGTQPQRIYAFVRGATGHLYVNYWNGSTWQWADQDTAFGPVGASPGVITYPEAGKQQIYAFITRSESDVIPRSLDINYWDGSKWQWFEQSGVPPVTGTPAAITYPEAGNQRSYAFVVGQFANQAAGHLFVNYRNGSQWVWTDQGAL